MREVLRRPGVGLLFAGEVASMFGDSVMLLVLLIWVKTLTGSSGLAGAVMLAMTAPSIIGPALGWVVDRFRRRPFLIAVNLLSALALLPLLAVRDRADVWIIYAVAGCYGISFTLASGAFSAMLKEMLPEDLLGAANGLFGTLSQGLRLVGPLIGAGLFVTIGAHSVVLIDVASFGIAALTLVGVRVVEARPERTELHWLTEMTAGARHVMRTIALRRATIALSAALLMLGATESLIFAYVGDGLHRPAAFVGVLVTVQGIGGLAGALVTPRIIRRAGEPTAISLGLMGFGICIALMTYPSLVLGFVAMPFSGAGIAMAMIGFGTLMQTRTPGELMGRVSTATGVLTSGAQAISVAAGAILVSIVDYRWLFALMSTVMLGAAAYLWRGRRDDAGPEWSRAGVDGSDDGSDDGDRVEVSLDLHDGRVRQS